ncbi:MAG: hypothetical protein ABWX87_00095 [Pseudoxanthomonas sp.]|jgi:hypothetical protein
MHAPRLVAASVLLTSLGLGACNPPSTPQPDKPPAPQSTAMSKAIHAPLDRAKAVEGQVQAAHDAQDKQIEADTQ